MTGPVLEVVVYQVADPDQFDHIREAARPTISALEGFLRWTHLPAADPSIRLDMVEWANAAAAAAAAALVQTHPDLAAFREAITAVNAFQHFPLPAASVMSEPPVGTGVEIGQFRLKSGVDAEAMRATYRTMREQHLSKQQGWRGQWLIELDDGLFVDLALAADRSRSEAICASWTGAPICDQFLSLIRDPDIRFGTLTD
jgi:hypothetical protein